MGRIKQIHLAGAYGIPEILEYQKQKKPGTWNYPTFFPFWEIMPGIPVLPVESSKPDLESLLVVLNMNQKVWDQLSDRFSLYPNRVLVQTEAILGWETGFNHSPQFDLFFNFDPAYKDLPGFVQVNIPYDPAFASSHRDRRGLAAWLAQWRHSRRMFISIYAQRFFPRKNKAALIATLSPQDRYQVRLRAAQKWKDWVDVYGRGWPKTLSNYRGVCMSKADVLRRYRYALVFENQRQPGYVTEKFLDCLLDGTVPIYWGDPTLESRLAEPMFYPIDDENTAIDHVLADRPGYNRRRAAILVHRHEIFEAYSTQRFVQTLHDAMQRYTQV